jgi:predicted Zn-dependent protease
MIGRENLLILKAKPVLVNLKMKSIVGCLSALLVFSAPVKSSLEEEIRAGDQIAALYLGSVSLVADQELNEFVNLLGRHLADQTERPELPWVFGVLDTDSINAFCTPGGKVFVTRGLYQILESEDELAAVLAHEIAHGVRQHHWKIVQKQKAAAQMIAKMQSNMRNANELFDQMNGIFTDVMTKGLDKRAEFDADRDGAVIAARAGYDSSALFGVLAKLDELKASEKTTELLFQTHPSPGERIDRLSIAFSNELEAAALPARLGTPLMKITAP